MGFARHADIADVTDPSASEALGQHTVSQVPVAHGEALRAQLLHDRTDDTGAGEDDFR